MVYEQDRDRLRSYLGYQLALPASAARRCTVPRGPRGVDCTPRATILCQFGDSTALLSPARPARDRGNDVDQLNIEMILEAAVENDSLAFRVPGFYLPYFSPVMARLFDWHGKFKQLLLRTSAQCLQNLCASAHMCWQDEEVDESKFSNV
jgi:hypothetical protein